MEAKEKELKVVEEAEKVSEQKKILFDLHELEEKLASFEEKGEAEIGEYLELLDKIEAIREKKPNKNKTL